VSETACANVRPLLPRIADGEASPAEAMLVARHLQDCTACRILLARERRLATILEEELEDRVLVGEDFLQDVMANLPKEPPPRPRTRRARGFLKLAGFSGLLLGLPALAMRISEHAATRLPSLALPRLESSGGDAGLESVVGVSRLLLAVADSLGRQLPSLHHSPLGLAGLIATCLLATAACGLGGTTLVALASHRISRMMR
jgi:hypothetical protein